MSYHVYVMGRFDNEPSEVFISYIYQWAADMAARFERRGLATTVKAKPIFRQNPTPELN